MAGPVRHVFRLLAIARTLARHDALFPLERIGVAPGIVAMARVLSRRRRTGRPGERLAEALQAMGPTAIKLGQALSTRSDLLGEEVAADLSLLQDRLPPFAGAKARETVAKELGAPVDELFAAFEDEPIAAASIAQVHFATTGDGAEVAVKVLRPGIEAAFARDLDLLRWLARMALRARPDFKRLKPVEVVGEFAATVDLEMDMRIEAAAASELAENFAGDDSFVIPEIDWARTARRVLTTSRIHGIPVDERKRIKKAGHDLDRLSANAAAIFFKQVFRDGFFHADPHPGNLFVTKDGALAAVDFGIMGRVDQATRVYLADMLIGFLTGDYRLVAEVHFQAGYVPAHKSVDAFMQASRAIGEPILDQPQSEISIARLLAQLFQVTETFEMETQPQLLLLQKTMLVMEGVGRKLNPSVDMWQLARPLVEDWIRENRGPEARLRDAAEEVAGTLRRLPKFLANAEKAAARIADGTARIEPNGGSERSPGPAARGEPHWPLWLAIAVLASVLLGVLAGAFLT